MSDPTGRILKLKLELKDRRIAELIEERDGALLGIELSKAGIAQEDMPEAIATARKLA